MSTTAAPVTWFEVHVTDVSKARAFYRDAFGWTFEDGPDGYTMVNPGDGAPIRGGITTIEVGHPGAMFNIQVEDVPAACERVEAAGGTVVASAQTTPFGLSFAYVADLDGSTFGVWTPPAG